MEHENIGSCKSGNCGGSCMLCCLFVCKHCGLFEGALTTDCPGEKVSFEVSQTIYKNGNLDFRVVPNFPNGIWVDSPNPYNQEKQKYNLDAKKTS